MWVEFTVRSLPCSERLFSGLTPLFPSPQKPTFPISKFGQEWYMKKHFVDVLPLNHHHCPVDVV